MLAESRRTRTCEMCETVGSQTLAKLAVYVYVYVLKRKYIKEKEFWEKERLKKRKTN